MKKSVFKSMRRLFAPALVMTTIFASSALLPAPANATYYGEKFEPADGKIISGVGQSNMADVVSAIQGTDPNYKPMMLAWYDNLSTLKANPNAYINPNLSQSLNLFPGSVIDYGLQLPQNNLAELSKVSDGTYDATIDRVGNQLKALAQNIFVRIGYEFDWNGNGYDSAKYKAAFQRIHDRWASLGVTNVAYIFCSQIYNVSQATIDAYYPGDTYVNWFAFDYFGNGTVPSTGTMYTNAAAHNKPIMLGETSKALTSDLKSTSMTNFINSMNTNSSLKAFQLINRNWPWTGSDSWGDGMYSEDPTAMNTFKTALQNSKYLTLNSSYYSPIAENIAPAFRGKAADLNGIAYDSTYDYKSLTTGYNYTLLNTNTVTLERTYWTTTSGEMNVDLTVPSGSSGYVYMRQLVVPAGADIYLGGGTGTRLVASGVNPTNYVKYKYVASDISNGKVRVRIDDRGTNLKLSDIGIQTISASAPAAPSNLTKSAQINDSVTLTWSGVTNAARYNVYRDGEYVGSTTSLSYMDNIVPEGNHTYTVTATSASQGEGNMSSGLQVVVSLAKSPVPVADAYVRDGSYASTNFGGDSTLDVKDSASAGFTRKSYLKFNVSGLSSIANAKLRVYGSNTTDATAVDVNIYSVADNSWTENGITWNSAPALGTLLGTVSVTNTAGYYEIDVTPFVQSQAASGNLVSLALVTTGDNEKMLQFNSRESTSNKPQLAISVNSIADSFVRDGSYASTNYGGGATLDLKGSASAGFTRKAYLKFDLSSLDSITNAKLRVYGSNTTDSTAVNVKCYSVTDNSWTESGLTWNNAPANGTLLSTVSVNNIAGYYEFDVTSFVQSQIASGSPVSLVLEITDANDKGIQINSRESATNKPELLVR